MNKQLNVGTTFEIPQTEGLRSADDSGNISAVLREPPPFHAPAEAEWHRMISEAAYYLAAKRNFQPSAELDDWLAAEAAAKDFLSSR